MSEIKLPEVGENIEAGQIVDIFVKEGDTVTKGQDLLELETDKASLPVPSPVAGTITKILVKKGDDVKVGSVIMHAETSDTPSPEKEESEAPAANEPATTADSSSEEDASDSDAETTEESSSDAGQYDTEVVVVGGGPGGYAAAFLAADLGLKVSLVDKEVNPGGVCLYRGCIPSKALLHVAKVLSESREAKAFGVTFAEPKIDIDKVRGWKESIVQQLTGGLGQLSKQRKVNYIQGTATFQDAHTLAIQTQDGDDQTLTFGHAVVATGSHPIRLPFAPDSKHILDSTSALELESIPATMLLVGAGYIGLELGTVYAALGTKVSCVEMTEGIIPGADRDLAKILDNRLKTTLEKIMLSTKVTKMEEIKDGVKVTFEDKDGKTFDETYEKVLVAIGRRPNSRGLGLENTKVQADQQGFLKIDAQRRTDEPSIFAIGDVAGNPMLAHKASHEGRVAVEVIAGHKAAFEPNAIPAVVFTDPEIAWCGITETEAKAQGRAVQVIKFPWAASGRALTLGRTDGLTKLIIDPETERILGVAIVGVGAGELISEGVLAVEMGSVAADLKLSIHPHPTISETIMESAESFFGQSTHVYRPRKRPSK